MNAKMLTQGAETTYAVVFETGDEVMAGLTAFAREHRLDAGRLTAIGGFSAATLGFFEVERKEFRKIPIAEQVEVLSLVGDITLDNGKPMVHAHVVVGTADGTARGGHILEAHVRPTLEVIVVESPNILHRAYDPATGLALIEL
ncbi:MAG TPA: PPC domain-containing DNA-binding protein [Thermomicrobiales bacterium]|nr:PPC domain-containing DNA-binding protein [Thermomicrobiales bacterium]